METPLHSATCSTIRNTHNNTSQKKKAASNNSVKSVTLNKPTVLVIEDNPINLRVAQLMLEELGCEVVMANSGQMALGLLQRPYDLIIADIGLGDMDGCVLAQQIRKNAGKNAKTPIIALTAHAFAEDQQRCIDSGMEAVLIKPVSEEDLQAIITRLGIVKS